MFYEKGGESDSANLPPPLPPPPNALFIRVIETRLDTGLGSIIIYMLGHISISTGRFSDGRRAMTAPRIELRVGWSTLIFTRCSKQGS